MEDVNGNYGYSTGGYTIAGLKNIQNMDLVLRSESMNKELLDIWVSGDEIKILYSRDTGKSIEKITGSMKGRTLRSSWKSVYHHYRNFSDEDRDRIKRVFDFVQSLIINGREEIPHGTKQGT